ncbi:MAG: Hpt domain-containing protein, partial [Acidobacteria bacterium]|nr:Hpt domain-containing protein [Acidobacteriota bacterium]
AFAEGDMDQVEQVAHALKGSSATLGAMRLSAACRKVEETARMDPLAVMPEDLEAVQRTYAEAATELGQLVAS